MVNWKKGVREWERRRKRDGKILTKQATKRHMHTSRLTSIKHRFFSSHHSCIPGLFNRGFRDIIAHIWHRSVTWSNCVSGRVLHFACQTWRDIWGALCCLLLIHDLCYCVWHVCGCGVRGCVCKKSCFKKVVCCCLWVECWLVKKKEWGHKKNAKESDRKLIESGEGSESCAGKDVLWCTWKTNTGFCVKWICETNWTNRKNLSWCTARIDFFPVVYWPHLRRHAVNASMCTFAWPCLKRKIHGVCDAIQMKSFLQCRQS